MKLYAQHGHAASDKMVRALEAGYIDGAILSPRNLVPSQAGQYIEQLRSINPSADVLLDPEFYATRYVGTPNAQLGHLEEWPYFVPRRRNELLHGSGAIESAIRSAFEFQRDIGCTQLISPTIYITSSFDSIEAAITISFMNQTKRTALDMGIQQPVYSTIAVGRDAIVDRQNYLTFLNAITTIEPLPDGVFVLVGAGSTDERVGTIRSEIMVPEVIAGWMLINYGLSLNNIRVINGYSDLLAPWLGVAGAYSGASGWWSTLQVFSMSRYIRQAGRGQQPLVRYLSNKLLNRITINEREAFAEMVPDIMNGLETDSLYISKEPNRSDEALQSWQALSRLCAEAAALEMSDGIRFLRTRIAEAKKLYDTLRDFGFSEKYEANMDYLRALDTSLILFEELAEL